MSKIPIKLRITAHLIYSAHTYEGNPLQGEDDHHCYLTPTSLIINCGWWNRNSECNEYSIEIINLPPELKGAMCYFKANGESWHVVVIENDRMTYVMYDVSSCNLVSQGRFEEPVTDDELM